MSRCLILIALLLLPGCSRGSSGDSKNDEISPSGELTPVDPPKFSELDHPWWRGAARNAIAPAAGGTSQQQVAYPVHWSETKNVVWKAAVPGRGLSSPVVVGNRVFLTSAEKGSEVQSVLCFDRTSGDLKWRNDVHQGKLGDAGHIDNTHASSTVACDGERVFCTFRHSGKIFITALDLNGRRLWQTAAGNQDAGWGFATSPTIYKELVILAADGEKAGFIAALNRKTGKIWWRKHRPKFDSYSSVTVAQLGGKDHALMCGGKRVIAYDPMTGETNWSVDAGTETMCGTVTCEGNRIYASGGYPQRVTVAIEAGAKSARVVWTNNFKVYVPSLLVCDGAIYGCDGSVLHCLNAKDGKRIWRGRVTKESYGSPIFAGKHVYVPTRDGRIAVIKPNAKRMEKVAVNSLGTSMDTTPTACGGRLYIRVATGDGDERQEWLYCVGEQKK